MAIVAMKHLRILALDRDRKILLDDLQRLGCVEIVAQQDRLLEQDASALLSKASTDLAVTQSRANTFRMALDSLSRYSTVKKSMFTPRPDVPLEKARDESFADETLETASEIVRLTQKIAAANALEGRLRNQIATLTPWISMDVPLDKTETKTCRIVFGVCPSSADKHELSGTLLSSVPESDVFFTYSDAEQHYLMLLFHKSAESDVFEVMKSFGFSRMDFKDMSGTARENINSRENQIRDIEADREALEQGISELGVRRADLELGLDINGLNAAREEAASRLLVTEKCVLLDGWVPVHAIHAISELLDCYDCAYETAEVTDEDNPPILLRNNKLTSPFTMVTKMYSMPDYRNIDPNPLIAPFYALFFGMMFADVAYGLILMVAGLFVTKKLKPKGPMVRYMFPLMTICGISSIIWGIIYGSYFADAISVISSTFFGKTISIPPLWIDPMNDPMMILIAACSLGAVHLLAGMCIKAYLLIRDGKPWDAVMDVGSWWLLFAGFAVVALTGGKNIWVMVAGFAALILTQGRANKSIFGKLFGGIASLYDITAYLSDILSYSRLMALGLAGGVLGSVFNTMGAMMGKSIFGFIFFVIIFIVGHAFNLGMNVIGTYVHAARLMYVEYFGKFYVGGGVSFAPLAMNTKYVDIKE